MGASNPFVAVGDPSKVVNTNPYTGGYMDTLQNTADFAKSNLDKYSDPTAALNYFMSISPELASLVSGQNSAYANSQLGLANTQSKQAVKDVFGTYSPSNSLYSGAAFNSAANAAEQVRQGAVSNILGAQNSLTSNLYGGALSSLTSGYNNASSVYAGIYNNAISNEGQIAAPNWWQPTYVSNPDYMSTKDWIGTGIGLATDIASIALAAPTGGASLAALGLGLGGGGGSGSVIPDFNPFASKGGFQMPSLPKTNPSFYGLS